MLQWCWRANGGTTSSNSDGSITSTVQANQAAGFSIITYTGNRCNMLLLGHGLTKAPTFVLCKNTIVIIGQFVHTWVKFWRCY